MTVAMINDLAAEGGVIASIIQNPDFVFYSEQLQPNHFSDQNNATIYAAVFDLATRGITKIDVYNLSTAIHGNPKLEDIPVATLTDYVDFSASAARTTPEEYMLAVDVVCDKAFRRDVFQGLKSCEAMCASEDNLDIQTQIYRVMDDTMLQYSSANMIPAYKDIVDDMWAKIVAKQSGEVSLMQFKFPALNEYVTIDPGELVLFAADKKRGKSMMLLNCTVDLLMKGKAVLYIDSELPTEQFTLRLLSHLTKISYKTIKWKRYGEDGERKIAEALALIKTWNFTHMYLPRLDETTIYSITKKIKHTRGIDVLVLDYLKSRRDGNAHDTYQELGRIADLVKNTLCGEMGIAGLGAVQMTSTGKVADSANIERTASTLIKLLPKSQEEIDRDGKKCGNYKAIIDCNRNGGLMSEDEYIDMVFDGDIILFEQAEQQHMASAPV